jgi:hypothetical protein
MQIITPEEFWRRYREEVRSTGTWDAYTSPPKTCKWKRIVIGAAVTVCESFGLIADTEYLRLDCLGYSQTNASDEDDWNLRVAFEHELGVRQGRNWTDELTKLAHVVADLRVLVGYRRLGERRSVYNILSDRLKKMGSRMTRVPDSRWLFVFGSGSDADYLDPWQPFTLDACGEIATLTDDKPFSPREWKPT